MNKDSVGGLIQRAMAQVVLLENLPLLVAIIDQNLHDSIRQNFCINKATTSGPIGNSFI